MCTCGVILMPRFKIILERYPAPMGSLHILATFRFGQKKEVGYCGSGIGVTPKTKVMATGKVLDFLGIQIKCQIQYILNFLHKL